MLPSSTVVRLGRVWLLTKFRLDAFGLVDPEGQTVRKLTSVVASVSVAFNVAASAPAGMGPPLPGPAICTSRVSPGPNGVLQGTELLVPPA